MVSYLYLGDEEKKKRELSVSFPKGARRLIGRCLYLRCFTLTPQLNDPECIVTFGRCALDPLSITFAGHRLLLTYPKATLLSLPRLFLARLHGSVTHGTSISRRRSKSASSRGWRCRNQFEARTRMPPILELNYLEGVRGGSSIFREDENSLLLLCYILLNRNDKPFA